MRLNLGSCDRHFEGFTSVDIAPGPGVDIVADLSERWPWPDSSVEEVLALDVCEHIGDIGSQLRCTACSWRGFRQDLLAMGSVGRLHCPACYNEYGTQWGIPLQRHSLSGRIHFLNELHRVLVPGGRATVETPNAARGVGYFQDPTHVSPYCLSTFKYFESGAFAHQRLSKLYGITAAFKVLSLTESRSNGEDPREEVWKIKAILEAVK